jgi:hypothetical protein
MYSRCTLHTRLTVPEVLQRLSRIVRPRRSAWQAIEAGLSWDHRNEPPFVGTLTGGHFRIRRVIAYRNDFRPVITGHVRPDTSGSRIELVLRLSVPVGIVMTIWIAAALVGSAFGVLGWLAGGGARGLLALFLPLFGGSLLWVGFSGEKRKALRLLGDACDAAPDMSLPNASGAPKEV